MIVVDASALVALLVAGPEGAWVAREMAGHEPAAPHLAPFEAANIIRRHEAAGMLSQSEAAQAHADLLALPMALADHASLASRAWELRANLTTYDACYIALAEALDVPLVTLDRRLAAAPGPRCPVLTPPR